MNAAVSSELLLLGSVTRPHGLDGVLRVHSYAESAASYTRAGRVILSPGGGEKQEFQVVSARPHKKGVLLGLKGLDSVEAAEAFRNAEVYVPRNALRRERGDEFFWYELIGLEVYLDTGAFVGALERVLRTGASDVYVVRDGTRETLVPATRDVIEEIDLDRKRMILSPMEGLLDLNEV